MLSYDQPFTFVKKSLFLESLQIISSYMCCMKDQSRLKSKTDVNFTSRIPLFLQCKKGDGNLGIYRDGNYITKIVRNYLKHDMVTTISLIDML